MVSFGDKIWSRMKNMFIWASTLLIATFGASYVMYLVEREESTSSIASLRDTYWWWINTVLGPGAQYGPITPEGRVIATFIMVAGFVLLALFISETTNIIRMIYRRRDDGNIKIRYSNHIVIFGYTSLTAGVMKVLRNSFGPKLRIVLISNDADRNPFPGFADFIHDNPINQSTLRDANVHGAIAAIILANDRFRDPDSYSLVIASGIEKQNSKVTTIVEIVDAENKDLFKKTNIDAFINRKELLNDLLDNNDRPKLLRIIAKESELQERDLTGTTGREHELI
jgi:voltage-gated potassium channel